MSNKRLILEESGVNWRHSLPLWAKYTKVAIDGFPFGFKEHAYLFDIFNDNSEQIILMKAAQLGATIWMVLRAIHQAIYPNAWRFGIPIKIGFYFPEREGLNMMVKGRVEKIMEQSPELRKYSKEKSRSWKPFDRSSLYFFYMGGTSTKDSTPLMSIFFDEVRLMASEDIDQAKERVSHSPIKYIQLVSTAGLPQKDIHHFFLNSDQKWFTTICDRCNCEQILPQEFPNCIAEHQYGPRSGQVYYICKKCREKIRDTQHGIYIPHGDPYHEASGYQVSQLISHRISAKEILTFFQNTTNIKEFYNAKLGMPYVDEENRPVTEDMLDDNINPLAEWGTVPGEETFMGVDQMSSQNYVFILTKSIIGKKRRIIWFEIIDDRDPFKRTAELMREYDVKVCVCDSEPNANDALRFAKEFGNRVFLAKYGHYDDIARWKDSWKPAAGQRKAEEDTYHKYKVFLDKFKSQERTLLQIKNGMVEWPDPDKRIQEAYPIKGGRRERMPIMKTHAYPMFSSAVKEQVAIDKEGHDYRWKWVYTSQIDPHALDALDYALRASERKRPSPFLITM